MWMTSALGGVSQGSYRAPGSQPGLNLGKHVGDDPLDVEHNRHLVSRHLGAHVLYMEQIHSADVAIISRPGDIPSKGDIPKVDALILDTRNWPHDKHIPALAVMVADCLPLALYNSEVMAVVHVGRKGADGGVVKNTIEAMMLNGIDPSGLQVGIGAHICGDCYQVDSTIAGTFLERYPEALKVQGARNFGLDLGLIVEKQLRQAGVEAAIKRLGGCTLCCDRYYSYRRSKTCGRQALILAKS
ncbi:MAG: polyphenol oxidase family protein [Actinomycetaceae bacterium]|nr:polyphenol oxidase family protein [Actinomycetaceae bacterium]